MKKNLSSREKSFSLLKKIGATFSFYRQINADHVRTKPQYRGGNAFAVVVIAIALSPYLVVQWVEHYGYLILISTLLLLLGVFLLMKSLQTEKEMSDTERRNRVLWHKYNDEGIVKRVERGIIWKGESAEQLIDSLGLPEGVESSEKEIWEYNGMIGYECSECRNGLAYNKGLYITLEDNEVVAWRCK